MTEIFAQAYENLLSEPQASKADWLMRLRHEGYQRFTAQGLPTTRDEEWKYTSLRALQERNFQRPKPHLDDAIRDQLGSWYDPEDACLLLVNGHFHSWLSPLREGLGLKLESLDQSLFQQPDSLQSWLARESLEKDRFLALNQAFLNDGIYLRVEKNQSIEQAMHVIHLLTGETADQAVFSRFFLHLQQGSQLELKESFLSFDSPNSFINPVSQVKVDAGAKLRHQRLQNHNLTTTHIDSLYVDIGRDAEYDSLQLDFGARLARHQVYISLIEPGAYLRLDAVSLAAENQHVDQHTSIDHKVAHTQSSQLYKSVVGSKGRSVFSGQIAIRPNAQQTLANQLNQNLLLSKDAEANTRPQMYIDADDVKCSHGATIGQLLEDELFYLRSRGIDGDAARNLLIEGFLRDVIQRHQHASGLPNIEELIKNRLVGLYGD